MSGFNNARVDSEFFAGTTLKSNFLCAIGYASDEIFPRLPRLTFEEAAEVLSRAETWQWGDFRPPPGVGRLGAAL